MSWKGLAAELEQATNDEPAATIARHSERSAAPTDSVADRPQPAAPTSPPQRTRSRSKVPYTERTRLVGIYFPHDIDAAFRQAALDLGIPNSEYVTDAVRARLQAEGRL